eukprot:Gb_37078 [translate_table: standard]
MFISGHEGTGLRLSALKPKSLLSPENDDVYLVSPNGTFFAGFYSVGYNAYVFGIWYAQLPHKTIVWMANRDNPVNGWESTLKLNKNGNLVLTDANRTVVWQTKTTKSDHVAELVLLETGNFVLRNKTENIVWASFDQPTDTLLPQQSLQDHELWSSITNSSYATGYYRLFFDSDNILSLSFNGFSTSTYWPDPDLVAYTSGRSHYNSQKFAFLIARGGFKSSDGYSFNTTDFGETPLRRLTLDTDGNLRAYSWDNTSLAWVVVWEAFTQLCKIHGLCGPNAICIYTPQPRCACPPSFRMANRSNWFQGCEPLFPLHNCSQQFSLIPLQHTDYYGNDLDTYRAYATFEQCQAICMNDCRCKGFAYRLDGMGKCFPKANLYNGFQSPAVANTLYIKVSAAFPYNSSHETLLTPLNLTCPPAKANPDKPLKPAKPDRDGPWKIAEGVLIPIAILEIASLSLGWWYLSKRYGNSVYLKKYGFPSLSGGPERFSFAKLQAATNNFTEIVGKGGFGTVYKGTLADGRAVAVKKLEGVSQGEAQFRAEVTIVGKIHHINLVRMSGFCAEGDNRMNVYEHIANGSLDKYLFSDHLKVLNWRERYGIAVGTAKGIAYLHEECLDWILHCDIKPQNILLDDHFLPKVSDFGLAKLVDRERTLCFSTIRGTRGYLAPEWVGNLPITAKADVYSFGIVLLEIVSGQNSTTFTYMATGGRQGHYFPQWAAEQMAAGKMREMVDPKLGNSMDLIAWEQVERVRPVVHSDREE